MKRLLMLLGLAVAGGAAHAAAQVVDIAFDADGRFTHTATLAPKELLEVCGKLPKGSRLHWSFEADAPLPFNIHVHQGKEVIYPARLEQAEKAQGLQTFDAEPAHCWMWTNKTTADVAIRLSLQR